MLSSQLYVWQAGNMGFRRAQACYTCNGDSFELAASISDPSMSGESSETDSPLFVGRDGFGLAGLKLGVSGTYGQDDKSLPDGDSDICGISDDVVWPISSAYSVKGEIAASEKLANFLNRSKLNPVTGDEQETVAGWTELTFTGSDFDLWAGGAFESLDDTEPGQTEDTWMIFAGLQWKLKSKLLRGAPVRLGVEVAHFDSSVDNGNNTDANQIFFSGQYTFREPAVPGRPAACQGGGPFRSGRKSYPATPGPCPAHAPSMADGASCRSRNGGPQSAETVPSFFAEDVISLLGIVALCVFWAVFQL